MFIKLAGVLAAAATLTACAGASTPKAASFSPATPAPATFTAAGPTAIAPRVITATGRGQSSGVPDLLTATLGVQTTGPDARSVLTTNSREAGALIGRLEADGVAAADIKTVQLSLNPEYANPAPGQGPRVSGYAAADTVSVSIRRLDRAGVILDDAAAAGGSDTVIQSLAYSVADEGPLLAAAHADAVHQAQNSAKAMADAAGVALGPLQVITDGTPAEVVSPYVPEAAGAASAAAVPVPVQAGTEQVSAEVTVTYAIG
jgi:uncharacterized protein